MKRLPTFSRPRAVTVDDAELMRPINVFLETLCEPARPVAPDVNAVIADVEEILSDVDQYLRDAQAHAQRIIAEARAQAEHIRHAA